jgi:hypothetical protein
MSPSQASLVDPEANVKQITPATRTSPFIVPPGLVLPVSPIKDNDERAAEKKFDGIGKVNQKWERKVSFGADVDLADDATVSAEWDERSSVLRVVVKRSDR